MCAALVAASAAGCGGSSTARDQSSPVPELGPVRLVSALPVSGHLSRRLTAPWAVSFDVRGQVAVSFGPRRYALRPDRHVEASGSAPSTLRLAGRGRVTDLIVSDPAYPASLLLHRLAELHARLRARQFPIGADRSDRLHIGRDRYWTSGFWAGALWQAAALEGQPFKRWALRATLNHFGHERTPTHDVGFMYGQSSLAAWQALCRARPAPRRLCARLRRSVLEAAGELLTLAGTDPGNGLIPVGPRGKRGDTIIDSVMNIAILPWATRVTGNPAYAQLAAHQANLLASLLVRPDGSTVQAVNYTRATGRVQSLATHQGISKSSTWSRGQGWAVYGFSQAAVALRSPRLLRVAERTAGYVAAHLPSTGVPRFDYDAPPGAPLDLSAGVITAAGLLHLASACHHLPGVCVHPPGRWITLAHRMIDAALTYVSPSPPLGFLGSQELNEHAHGCWCNGAELTFGLSYALEAVRLSQRM